jgi:hypothetical protein
MKLAVIDVSGLQEAKREEAARQIARQEGHRPFDLQRGPVWRAGLIRLGEDEHVLVLCIHHIASDGWSSALLVRESVQLFESLQKGNRSPLAELKVQYADYAMWQRGWLQGEVLESQMEYWKRKLRQAPVSEIPTDKKRVEKKQQRSSKEEIRVSEELTAQLKQMSRREGVTLFMTMVAAFQIVIGRYAGQEDVVVGTDVANRNRYETEGLIGFFVNQLVLRTDLSGNPSFRELLQRVRETVLEAYEHQDVPFEKIVEEIAPARHADRSPLFQVKLVLQNIPDEKVRLSNTHIRLSDFDLSGIENGMSKFDILLNIAETDAGLIGWNHYNSDLYDASAVRSLLRFFEATLTTIVLENDIIDLPKKDLLRRINQQVRHSLNQATKNSYARRSITVSRI